MLKVNIAENTAEQLENLLEKYDWSDEKVNTIDELIEFIVADYK